MKNIILLSDGTGNSAAKLHKTNVWRLYQALDRSGPKPGTPEQLAYYDDGVGSSKVKLWALAGGAFGWGLKRNVLDLYTFLCRHYVKGDEIYCFGFSRGAFTIRVLCGLIYNQGLVSAKGKTETELHQLAKEEFLAYRKNYKSGFKTVSQSIQARLKKMHQFLPGDNGRITEKQPYKGSPDSPRIRFLGLWDTVDAYGLPIDDLTRAWKWLFPLSIPNHNPLENIDRICHALALDDERHTFHPVLFNEKGNDTYVPFTNGPKVCQVWFTGVHMNVGGGYPDDALAMVSLHWMMCEAAAAKLELNEEDCNKITKMADAHGKLYDSRRGLLGIYRYQPRKLELLTNERKGKNNQVVTDLPKIHESVFERIKSDVRNYAPITFPARYTVVTYQGEVIDLPPGSQKSEIAENEDQASLRANMQEDVWDLVWWRRFVYFFSVVLGFWLALFPLFYPATGTCEGLFCFLTSIVRGIGSLLPGFLDPWFLAYESHPGKFGGLAGALVFMLFRSAKLQRMIRDKMHNLWKPVMLNYTNMDNCMEVPAVRSNSFLYRLRSNRWYQALFKFIKKGLLPIVAALPVIWLLPAVPSQGIFSMIASAGLMCKSTPRDTLSPGVLKQGHFPSTSLCWASGVQLTAGKTYRITLSIDEDVGWKDRNIEIGINGLDQEKIKPLKTKLLMYLGVPFRRLLGEPWFKPIARIGSRGSDEYPLEPVTYSTHGDPTRELIAEITARNSGELFLFVNDAVLPVWPEDWQWFYQNNQGTARVTVQPIPLPKIDHPKDGRKQVNSGVRPNIPTTN